MGVEFGACGLASICRGLMTDPAGSVCAHEFKGSSARQLCTASRIHLYDTVSAYAYIYIHTYAYAYVYIHIYICICVCLMCACL